VDPGRSLRADRRSTKSMNRGATGFLPWTAPIGLWPETEPLGRSVVRYSRQFIPWFLPASREVGDCGLCNAPPARLAVSVRRRSPDRHRPSRPAHFRCRHAKSSSTCMSRTAKSSLLFPVM
jgi:hypothetical protein